MTEEEKGQEATRAMIIRAILNFAVKVTVSEDEKKILVVITL